MEYKVLGLCGQMASGKDYVYEYLRDDDPFRRVMRMGFADGVRRELVQEVLGALGINLGDSAGAGNWAKPYSAGQRWLMQQWGTDYRRAQDPDYWVKAGLAFIEEQAQPGDLWVVTDVRFANEVAAIEGLGHNGTTALVTAPVDVRAARLGITAYELRKRTEHASELMDFDATHTIYNNGNVTPRIGQALEAWIG